MDECKVELGDRVEVGGYRGTVKYVGPVPSTSGTWLGVDWDDPSRGKHSGTYAGVTYFNARYKESGSLVRANKLSIGQSIVDSIKDKYGGHKKVMDAQEIQEIEKAINAPFLEMVGFDKIAQKQSFDSLKVIGVSGERVKESGSPGELKDLCPRVEELDLSKNLLTNWLAVSQITSQLPLLTFLDLSENRLSYDENVEDIKKCFSKLEFLVLSRMEYTWEDILHCTQMWPQINKLQVSHNKITSLSILPCGILSNLVSLSIEGNNIMYWSEIEKLGYLQKLEILNASYTGLSKIIISSSKLFPALKFILLSGNFINNWESISELNKLKCLTELKFRDNPITAGMDCLTVRQMVIARITFLKILNGQEIPDDERRGAEYDYMKQNAKIWHETKNDIMKQEVFATLHPRYSFLVQKYGEIDETEFEVKSTALKTKLTDINITCENRSVKKRLPLGMSIQKLKNLLQKLLKVEASPKDLTLISAKNPVLRIPLDDEMKDLNFYSVEEGDIIDVQY